jgi:signal transduction histidine kinase/CheY-like chemotaxis protein
MGKKIVVSFRKALILGLTVIGFWIFAWMLVFLYLQNIRKKKSSFTRWMMEQEVRFIESHTLFQKFIADDYKSEKFYLNTNQTSISEYIRIQRNIQDSLKYLSARASESERGLSQKLTNLAMAHSSFIDELTRLRVLYNLRGFRDWGAEGEMRKNSHLLEDAKLIPEIQVLRLRRLEKDFMLRGDSIYVIRFNHLAAGLLDNQPGNQEANRVLLNYITIFNQYVKIHKEIGTFSSNGLLDKTHRSREEIATLFNNIIQTHQLEIGRFEQKIGLYLLGLTLLLTCIILLLGRFIVNSLSIDLKKLHERIQRFRAEGWIHENKPEENQESLIKEISELNNAFDNLRGKLSNSIDRMHDAYRGAKKASEAKSVFLANMSHEIRTPLNGIIGMIHVLSQSEMNQSQREHIETLEYSARHLIDLLNMILDYSKIEAGKVQLEEVSFDLLHELNMLAKSNKPKFEEKKLKLSIDFQINLSHEVIGDITKLKQVILNLLSNALKFTEQGEVSIKASSELRNQTEVLIHISISDQGVGIPPDRIPKLFSPFTQSDQSVTRKYGGTGLGLSISQHLVNLMGGSISVKSVPGEGSVFFFTVKAILGKKIQQQLSLSSIQNQSSIPVKVLLVEDNLVNQKVMKLLLESRNVNIDIANHGAEAVQLFLQNEYQLILMDIQMPVMDGLEATRRIIASQKYSDMPIPVIALSANAMAEDRSKAISSGLSGFLSKPIDVRELDQILNNIRRNIPA